MSRPSAELQAAAPPPDPFDGLGDVVVRGGNEPFLLTDPETAWLVVKGSVGVFAIRLAQGEPAGRRRHLFQAGAGSLLLGVCQDSSITFAALAVPAADTQLRRIRRADLQKLGSTSEGTARLTPLIEGWVGSLALALRHDLAPTSPQTIQAGTPLGLPAGAAARPVAGVVWVHPATGSIRLIGRPDAAITRADGYLPLTPGAWVEAAENADLQIVDTARYLQQDSAWAGLDRFADRVLVCIGQDAATAADSEAARLEQRTEFDQLTLTDSLGQIASVMEPGLAPMATAAGLPGTDPLLAACQLIGGRLGIEFVPAPRVFGGRAGRDPLRNICEASRVRRRPVELTGTWWREENGPLLAYRTNDRRPIALLPAGGRRYVLIDPVDGTRTRVDATVAATLDRTADQLYRPFPQQKLSAGRLFLFGLRGSYRDLWLIILMGLAGGVLTMAIPIATSLLFGQIIPNADRGQVVQLGIGLTVAAIAAMLFQLVRAFAVLRIETKMEMDLQAAVWDRLLSLPVPFFRRYSTGDLANRANGIGAIRQILTGAVTTTILGAVTSLFSFALLYYYDPPLALVATGLFVFVVVISTLAVMVQVHYQTQVYTIQGHLFGVIYRFLENMGKIHVAGAEPRAFARWAHQFADQKRYSTKAGMVANGIAVFNTAFPIVAAATLFVSVVVIRGEDLSTSSFLAFNAAFGQFFAAALLVNASMNMILNVFPIFDRLRPILNTEPEVSEIKSVPGELSGQIEVNQVEFRYDADGPLILRGLSLDVKPGEFVALAGPSGSGKSTLFRLLLGFEEPESGSIYYDGQDLSQLDIREVRRQIGVVLQDAQLMPGDVYTNIVGGSLLPMEDAWEAARMAGIADDIQRMPMGMYTTVSEGGASFSGGQAQRLMIARALVTKPRIILFDEATSALDNVTQAIVTDSLMKLNATLVVIAHRLSTIRNADRIFVVDQGQVVQSGNYDRLMQEAGLFADLVRRQLI